MDKNTKDRMIGNELVKMGAITQDQLEKIMKL